MLNFTFFREMQPVWCRQVSKYDITQSSRDCIIIIAMNERDRGCGIMIVVEIERVLDFDRLYAP